MIEYFRPLDQAEFEEGRVSRLMPEELQIMGEYALRLMAPGEDYYAEEMGSLVQAIEPHERPGYFKIRTLIKPSKERKGASIPWLTNPIGHILMRSETDPNSEIQFGYFMGTNEFDGDLDIVEAAEQLLVVASRPLVVAHAPLPAY